MRFCNSAIFFFAALLAPAPACPANAVAPALLLEVVQGDGAIHNVAGRFFVHPIVRLTDQGKPVAGAVVTFLLPQVGPGATFPDGPILTTTTGDDGTAAARGLRPNSLTGQWEIRVSASFSGRTARATILQTNAAPIAPVSAKSRSRAYWVIAVVAGGALAGTVAALSGGAASAASSPAAATPVPPPAVTTPPTVISVAGGSFGPPAP